MAIYETRTNVTSSQVWEGATGGAPQRHWSTRHAREGRSQMGSMAFVRAPECPQDIHIYATSVSPDPQRFETLRKLSGESLTATTAGQTPPPSVCGLPLQKPIRDRTGKGALNPITALPPPPPPLQFVKRSQRRSPLVGTAVRRPCLPGANRFEAQEAGGDPGLGARDSDRRRPGASPGPSCRPGTVPEKHPAKGKVGGNGENWGGDGGK